MKFLIGFLSGILLVMLALGAYYYFEIRQSNKTQPVKYSPPINQYKPSKKVDKSNSPKKVHKYRSSDLVLYRWYDDNNNRRYSRKPPMDRAFSVYTYKPTQKSPPIVELPAQSKIAKRDRSSRVSHSNLDRKQLVISKNSNAACRITVGLLIETKKKIRRHTGSRPSMWCSNYWQHIQELRKLRRDGHRCNYSELPPRTC